MSDEYSFGQRIQDHVSLAIANQKKVIEEASVLAAKAGVGVWVEVEFTMDKIIITAEPNVRVPVGQVWAPDFTKFKDKSLEEGIRNIPQPIKE